MERIKKLKGSGDMTQFCLDVSFKINELIDTVWEEHLDVEIRLRKIEHRLACLEEVSETPESRVEWAIEQYKKWMADVEEHGTDESFEDRLRRVR